MNILINVSRTRWHLVLHPVFAIVITLYLFYLDEGIHTFIWMHNLGSWLLFPIYASFFMFGQWLVKHFMLRTYTGLLQTILACVIGSGLELMMAMILFV